MSTALAPVVLTVVRSDGFVHFGDVIQLAHCGNGAVLSADVEDVVRSFLCTVRERVSPSHTCDGRLSH